MAELALSGELGSNHITEAMEWNIARRAERFTARIGVPPVLSIISANPEHPPSATYMKLKQDLGYRLGVQVNTYPFDSVEGMRQRIETDNDEDLVNGTIIQLPLRDADAHLTDDILELVALRKDVDGLAQGSHFLPATVRAIETWFGAHGIDVLSEQVALVGLGRLVNAPLYLDLIEQGATGVEGFDKNSPALERIRGIHEARVIVSATGHSGLLTPDLFLPDTEPKVLVDVGTAEQKGSQLGDVSDELRQYALENSWAITPKKGGIGKLTVRALLANLMDAAEAQRGITEPLGDYLREVSIRATSGNRPADLFPHRAL